MATFMGIDLDMVSVLNEHAVYLFQPLLEEHELGSSFSRPSIRLLDCHWDNRKGHIVVPLSLHSTYHVTRGSRSGLTDLRADAAGQHGYAPIVDVSTAFQIGSSLPNVLQPVVAYEGERF